MKQRNGMKTGGTVSKISRCIRNQGKRFCAALLSASMIICHTGLTVSANQSLEPDLSRFEIESVALYQAFQKAVIKGNIIDEMEFEGDAAGDYEELFDGEVYELYPEISKNASGVSLRVFGRLGPGAEVSLDYDYRLNELDEVIFLVSNSTNREQKAVIYINDEELGDKQTEVFTIEPKSSSGSGNSITVPTSVPGQTGGPGQTGTNTEVTETVNPAEESGEENVTQDENSSENESNLAEESRPAEEEGTGEESGSVEESREEAEGSEGTSNPEIEESENISQESGGQTEETEGVIEEAEETKEESEETNEEQKEAEEAEEVTEDEKAEDSMETEEISEDVEGNTDDSGEALEEAVEEASEITDDSGNETVAISSHKVYRVAESLSTPSDAEVNQNVTETKESAEPASPSDAGRDMMTGILYESAELKGKSVRAYVFTADELGLTQFGDVYEVSLDDIIVRANVPMGTFSDDVDLIVEKLEENTDEYDSAKEALDRSDDVQYDGMMALDISFRNSDGEEIEPDGEVRVMIEMKKSALPEEADLESLAVHHLAEDDNKSEVEVQVVADAADEAEGTVEVDEEENLIAAFSVESFSTFTITWTSGSRKPNIQFICVDSSGRGIGSNGESVAEVGKRVSLSMQKYIDGYSWKEARYQTFNGDEITSYEILEGGNSISFYNGQTVKNTTIIRNNQTFTIYMIYEKRGVPTDSISFEYTRKDELDSYYSSGGGISAYKDESWMRYTIDLYDPDSTANDKVTHLDDYNGESVKPDEYTFMLDHLTINEAMMGDMGISIPGYVFDNAYFYWYSNTEGERVFVTDIRNTGQISDGRSDYPSYLGYKAKWEGEEEYYSGKDYGALENYLAYNPTGVIRFVFKKVSDKVKYQVVYADRFQQAQSTVVEKQDMETNWDKTEGKYYGKIEKAIPGIGDISHKDYEFVGWCKETDESGNGVGELITENDLKEQKFYADAYYYAKWIPVAPKTVDLTIQKQVTGNMGDKTKEFEFTYTYEIDGKETSGTFQLKDSEITTIQGVPYGAKVKVTELDSDGYMTAVKKDNNAEEITVSPEENGIVQKIYEFEITEETETIEVIFVNHKQMNVPTGVHSGRLPHLLMLALAAFGMACMTATGVTAKVRKKDDEQ